MRNVCLLTLMLLVVGATSSAAQSGVEKNVVYGMYSGLGLLMDIYHPEVPNGRGILVVPGSAFSRPLGYDAPQLKDAPFVQDFVGTLTRAGYTVFAPNHRATPRFEYPSPVDDIQRAVRFIRAHAAAYGIDSERLGALGASSGGYMASMLGTLDGAGDAADPDPVNRLSSKVQAVVAIMTPFDLAQQREYSGGIPEALFVGASLDPNTSPSEVERRRYLVASPITYVTAGDPPFLLFHGDNDTAISVEQSRMMAAALQRVGSEVTLVIVPGGGHGRNFGFAPDDNRLADYYATVVRWFDEHLR